MFYRLNEKGNAAIFNDAGTVVTSMAANVYPVGSDVSARYDHPGGIVLSVSDAYAAGVSKEG